MISKFLFTFACAAPFALCLQPEPPVGTEPSPMEAFAKTSSVRVAWSGEIGRLERGTTKAVITALVLDDSGHQMRGVMIDLSNVNAKDRIYLDEEATERTRAAMVEIDDALARPGAPGGNGCMGAREFWPLYDWPWNKYHELNANVCGAEPVLILYGRGKDGSYRLPGEHPTALAAILARGTAVLSAH